VQAQAPEQLLALVPVQALPQVQALVRVPKWLSLAASGWSWAQSPNTSTPARQPKWQPLRQSMFSRCCSWTQSFPKYRPLKYVVAESDEKVSDPAKMQSGNAGIARMGEKWRALRESNPSLQRERLSS
jgi:hypothetical protein